MSRVADIYRFGTKSKAWKLLHRGGTPWLAERRHLPFGMCDETCLGDGESVPAPRVTSQFCRQELEGDEAMQPRVLSLVDDSHPAAAELLEDAVVGDGLADHCAEMLGLGGV